MSKAPSKPIECFMYLIGSEGRFPACKIGITKNVDSRLKTLQCGNPNVLWVSKQWGYQSRATAEVMESIMHCAFSSYRMTGEWFSVHCDDAIKVMDWVFERLHKQDVDPNLLMLEGGDLLDEITMGRAQ